MTDAQRQHLLDALLQASETVAAACDTNSSSPVEHCAGWTVADLTAHLADVQWFWTDAMANNAVSLADVQHPPGLPTDTEPSAYLRAQTAPLVAALAERSDDHHIWTWFEPEQNVGWLVRRQVLEAAVHAWDAQNASGASRPVASDVAVLGLVEFCEVMARNLIDNPAPKVSLDLAPTDNPWRGTAQFTDAPGVPVSATASELFLMLWGRRPAPTPDIAISLAQVNLS